jgi:hypothetical protein
VMETRHARECAPFAKGKRAQHACRADAARRRTKLDEVLARDHPWLRRSPGRASTIRNSRLRPSDRGVRRRLDRLIRRRLRLGLAPGQQNGDRSNCRPRRKTPMASFCCFRSLKQGPGPAVRRQLRVAEKQRLSVRRELCHRRQGRRFHAIATVQRTSRHPTQRVMHPGDRPPSRSNHSCIYPRRLSQPTAIWFQRERRAGTPGAPGCRLPP